MELQLGGKVAVVTGASRGIGLAIARALTSEGVHVIGAARRVTDELKHVSELAISADLSTPDGARGVIDAAIAKFGGIDILINNVGAGDTNQLKLGGFSTLTMSSGASYLT